MTTPITSLVDAFRQVDDPRMARGIRHPYVSLLTLTFLGLLCRQTDMASLQRWAKDHWRSLKGPLGFTHKRSPHATTISRGLANFSLEQFRNVFARWVLTQPRATEAVTVAVDGKTSKQGHDAQGEPVHMLNVFAHELNLCLAQFPVTGGKPTEPQTLEAGLEELLAHYPFIRLFTADALFTQRPLARVLIKANRDFLFAVKDNQPALLEAVLTSFRDADQREPDAETLEKKARNCTSDGSGSWTARRSPTSARQPGFRASR